MFKISAEWDSISREWLTGYEISYRIGAPTFTSTLRQTGNLNTATVHTFLKILSLIPDSLITRKNSIETAKDIADKAKEVLEVGGLNTEKGRNMLTRFDRELQKSKGKLNPGSTADLTASSIMVSLNNDDALPVY